MIRSARISPVFVSSTFSDRKTARNVRPARMLPCPRELGPQHGTRFQAIDLRAGGGEARRPVSIKRE